MEYREQIITVIRQTNIYVSIEKYQYERQCNDRKRQRKIAAMKIKTASFMRR
jgi:hypothetical protein